jgi:hypothetical protein
MTPTVQAQLIRNQLSRLGRGDVEVVIETDGEVLLSDARGDWRGFIQELLYELDRRTSRSVGNLLETLPKPRPS